MFHDEREGYFMSRTFTIYSQRLAGYLMLQGFVLEDIGVNNHNSSKRVFFFKDSAELQQAIRAYNNK